MERSLRRKMREDSRHRSLTPPPSLREVPQGASEATTERQLEALEAPRNQQEKTSRPTVVPRGEGEETEARAPWGTGIHLQGPPGSKSGQELGLPYESDPQGKIQGTAHGRKRAQNLAHNEPKMHAEPKASGESHAQAHLNPPQGQEGTDGDETEEASEGVKRAPRRRKADTGIQEAGEARRRSSQKQEPPDESKPKEKIRDRSPTPTPPSRGVPQ